jgi:hypothetical protein
MAMLGLIGGPLIIIAGVLVIFDVIDTGGVVDGVMTIPEALWEISLGIYLVVKGFRPSPILSGDAATVPQTS